jgi:hypothetical protein
MTMLRLPDGFSWCRNCGTPIGPTGSNAEARIQSVARILAEQPDGLPIVLTREQWAVVDESLGMSAREPLIGPGVADSIAYAILTQLAALTEGE